MKKVMILMLGLVASTASFATTSEPAKPVVTQSRVVMSRDHKLKLFVGPYASKGLVTIQDAKGQPLYLATVSLQKGLNQQFDFTDLPVGTYQLSLTVGEQTVAKTFVVQANPNESFLMQ